MASVEIRDDTIWAKHIDNTILKQRIASLAPGDVIELEVNGIVGQWEKMQDGKDGRPTMGIKPIGAMAIIWKKLQARRGNRVAVRETQTADRYLESVSALMSEWDSPEDNEAFRDL